VLKDVAVLRDIARTAHTQTRFFFDGRFPRERCETLYELWIEQSVHGHADHVVVPEIHGAAAGYVTCHRDGHAGRIGLVGLHESARGRGVGVAMIRAALEWFASQHIGEVSVVTQGRNVAASRLYERCGFEMRSALATYHWWPRQVSG
jgi:ribosomal protein S18 acetylase RimI-like enzyme